jgi:1,4-dihydroxy-2-naphthoyl-CoA hydrolase
MAIWKTADLNISVMDAQRKGTMMEHLGIVLTEIGDDFIKATMPVDHRTTQPIGLVHGGAYVALAETIGSIAANLCLDTTKEYALGLDINSNHLRSIKEGFVTGIARPIHIGGKTQVWEIKCFDDKERLLNISRLTMMVLSGKS